MVLVPFLNDHYILYNVSKASTIPQELTLSNGAVIIHPLMVLSCYSSIFTILASAASIDYFSNNLTNGRLSVSGLVYLKRLSFTYTKVITLSIIIGAY